MNELDSILQKVGSVAIQRLTIESAYTPRAVVEDPLKPQSRAAGTGDSVADALLKLLRLKVTIDTPVGPQVITPWGEPGESRWPQVELAGQVVGGVLAIGLAWYLIKGALK